MARIVCQVLQRAERITFLWSEGAASFEPYHLEGAERAGLLRVAAQIHAALAGNDAALAQLGHQLYRAVFRRDAGDYGSAEAVQGWLARLIASNSVERIEFLSDAPGVIPWNLLCEAENAGYWGARFNLGAGRRVNALRQNPAQVNPTQLVVADRALVEQLSEQQRLFLKPGDRGRLAHSLSALEEELQQGSPDILLLLVRIEKGQLHLGGDAFGVSDLQRLIAEPSEGNPDPLFVLMGCGDAAEQSSWQGILGDASAAFSGLVANEALLSPARAFAVGQTLAQRFAEGKQGVGEILCALRQEHGAPALAFSAFCPPQVRVVAEGAADAPPAELPAENVPLPALPYRPFAAFEVEDRALLIGREEDVLRGGLLVDQFDAVGVVLHGSPAVGKTSYLQAGLLPFLEQECVGFTVLRDRNPLSPPVENGELGYPILILRCTSDLAGQFADALSAFCAQPLVYTTPAGTQVTVELPTILQKTVTGTAPIGEPSTAIQASAAATSISATPGDDDEVGDGPPTPRELWIALRDNKDLLARLLDAVTRALPFELVIAVDQGEDLITLVRTAQEQERREKAIDMLMHVTRTAPRCKILFTIRSQAIGQFASQFPDGRLPQSWRPFCVRPLTRLELTDVLLAPTSREEIPRSTEVPFQKYGFTFEDGVTDKIVAEAIDASVADQQNPLPIIHAVGALLYDSVVLAKHQSTVHAGALKDTVEVKNALAKYLDRTLEKLTLSNQSRQALRDLIGKMCLSHRDGTLSRDLIGQGELKKLWSLSAEPVEPAVDLAVQEGGLFDVSELIVGGQTDLFVSLPQDSLAQLGKKIRGEREKQAAVRARMIDVLWIMIPLVFLAAAVTFWVTRNYGAASAFSREEILEKLGEIEAEHKKERAKTDLLLFSQVQRPLYYAEMGQANQALNAGNALYVRRSLEAPLKMFPPEVQKKLPDLRGFDWHYAWRQIHCERFLCEGHKRAVHAVTLSPDGQWAASAGADGTARVWSVATGKALTVIEASASPIHAVAFAPDGKSLASAGADKSVRLWDLSKLKTDFLEITKEAKTLTGHEGEIHALAFGKDANTLASAGADKTVIIWDLATGKEKHKLKEHTATVQALVFAPDGKTLVSAGDEADFIVWDASAGKKTHTGKTAYRTIAALALAPDGKLCTGGAENISGADFGMIRFWTLADAKEVLKPIQHGAGVLAVAFAPDGKWLVSGGRDQVIRLWNIDTRVQERYFLGHVDPIRGLAFGKDVILSGSSDADVKIWDPAKSSGPDVINAHNDWVQALALDARDTLLASGSRDGSVKLWDPRSGQAAKLLDADSGKPFQDLPVHKGAVAALAFSHHADKEPIFLAVGTRGGKEDADIKVWQLTAADKDGWKVKEFATLKGHKKGVTCLAFHPVTKKADLLVSGSADHTVKLWNVKTGKVETSFDGHKDEVRCVAFSFDERAVFSGGKDGIICYNDFEHPKEIRKFADLHTGAIESIDVFMRVSQEDEHAAQLNGLVTAGADQAIRVWSYDQRVTNPKAKAQKLYPELWSHTQPITCVAYHETKSLIASASFDGAIKLHDPNNERFTLVGHQDAVRALVIASDQSFLASASNDKTVRIWRAAAKKVVK